jgi:hypothetical protein
MTAFRDVLADDVDAVFLNSEEFAAPTVFNGQTVMAVTDDGYAAFDGNRGGGDALADVSGLALEQQTRTLRIKDALDQDVMPEQRVIVDGEAWIVRSVKVEDGILVIVMIQGFA